MANNFYEHDNPFVAGTLVASAAVNSQLDLIETAFEAVETDLTKRVRFPNSFSGNNVIPTQTFANKIIYVNSSGDADLYSMATFDAAVISATTAATTAATQAGIATTAATNAGTSETNADTSEANAGTSEANAAASASAAAASAAAAAASAGQNSYTHPTFNGDDINLDTGALSGATVISDLDFNITTNGQGHVTDANATVNTRTLTLSNLGYSGDTDANNYQHPSYSTTNINTSGATIVDVISTTSQGHVTALGTRTLTGSDLGINKAYIDALNINADSLDSLTSTDFLRSNASDTMTGNLTVTGNIYGGSSGTIGTGVGSGSVAMTINDGQGNANITFNHIAGVADQAGNCGRIVFNTDDTTNAKMSFEIEDNATAGSVTTVEQFSITDTGVTATSNITAYSDERIKNNIETIDVALEKVTKMRGVYYNRNDLGEEKAHVRHTGVIAQEVLEVLPEVVNQDDKGIYSVAYGNIVGLLIEAIKEQQAQIDELKAAQ